MTPLTSKSITLIFSLTVLVSINSYCQTKEQASIYRIKPNDTLTVELMYLGCSGGLQFKYDFYKKDEQLYGISYKPEQSSMRNPDWKVDTIISMNRHSIKLVAEYESNLLNYKPSPKTNGWTGGGQFKIYSNYGQKTEREINGSDSFNFGDNIISIFRRKK
jgi:hypothetical protein